MTARVPADAPLSGQGETAVRPRPVAKTKSNSDVAAATTAPERIAAQETADLEDSAAFDTITGEVRFASATFSIRFLTLVM
jgi:hypothetical protein